MNDQPCFGDTPSSSDTDLERLFELLQAYEGQGAFNQYRDNHPTLDRLNGAGIRRRNLHAYLETFAAASYLLVGEAAGYAGCRFSGIPFTGEVQIVGPECLPWARELGLERSSSGKDPSPGLWRERSGQIVWEAFDGRRDCVLWNTFPWHPYGDELLSNRKPRKSEIDSAIEVLTCILRLFAGAEVHAIGRVSQNTLARLGIDAPYIRHPSHGGKARFTQGVQALPRRGPRRPVRF
jgi:hypothetical protein